MTSTLLTDLDSDRSATAQGASSIISAMPSCRRCGSCCGTVGRSCWAWMVLRRVCSDRVGEPTSIVGASIL